MVPGVPHHVTQRGNGRQQTFFGDTDYAAYVDLMRRHAAEQGVAVRHWVLMPNHVHLVLVPRRAGSLRAFMARVSRAYAGMIHTREQRTGHFWQDRFGCVAMDEAHRAAALLYISDNPVRARLAPSARDWRWSGIHALLDGRDDGLTDAEGVGARRAWLAAQLAVGHGPPEEAAGALRQAESIGRPLGDDRFLALVEQATGRDGRPRKRGPKAKVELSALSP